ncbi:MAG: sigma-70 family RNA polymerase sigma factor [Vicinamibacterales bacterium]
MPTPPVDISDLLAAWSHGDRAALDQLVPLVYDELKRLAHAQMLGERPGHPLQTTALVNEAYLRLVDITRVRWQNRAHFLAVAAQSMRRVLVGVARTRRAQKRGGDVRLVPLAEVAPPATAPALDVEALDEALATLARTEPRKAQVVELRYFGGLTVEEAGEVLGVSPETVLRDWKFARLWLIRELGTRAGRPGPKVAGDDA